MVFRVEVNLFLAAHGLYNLTQIAGFFLLGSANQSTKARQTMLEILKATPLSNFIHVSAFIVFKPEFSMTEILDTG